MTEKQITDIFDKWCKDNSIKYVSKNDARNHARASSDGCPDRMLPIRRGITIYIEFKTPEKFKTKDNGLRPKQIEWRSYLLDHGFKYYLLDSAENAIEIIKKYL